METLEKTKIDVLGLSLAKVRRILKRHRGAKADIARRANVGISMISHCVRGEMYSPRVTRIMYEKVAELLEKEEREGVIIP